MKNEAPTHTFVADTQEVRFKDLKVGDLLWSPFGYEASVQSVHVYGVVDVVVKVERGPEAGKLQIITGYPLDITEVKRGVKRQD